MGKIYIVKFTSGKWENQWLLNASGTIHFFLEKPELITLLPIIGEEGVSCGPLIEEISVEEIPEINSSTLINSQNAVGY